MYEKLWSPSTRRIELLPKKLQQDPDLCDLDLLTPAWYSEGVTARQNNNRLLLASRGARILRQMPVFWKIIFSNATISTPQDEIQLDNISPAIQISDAGRQSRPHFPYLAPSRMFCPYPRPSLLGVRCSPNAQRTAWHFPQKFSPIIFFTKIDWVNKKQKQILS